MDSGATETSHIPRTLTHMVHKQMNGWVKYNNNYLQMNVLLLPYFVTYKLNHHNSTTNFSEICHESLMHNTIYLFDSESCAILVFYL